MLLFQYLPPVTAVLHHRVLPEQHCGGEKKVVLEERSFEFSGFHKGLEEWSFVETTSIKNTTVRNRGPEET